MTGAPDEVNVAMPEARPGRVGMRGWAGAALRTVYPPLCLLCGGAGDHGLDVCRACAFELPWIQLGCPSCGLELRAEDAPCLGCARHPPVQDATLSALVYRFPVDRLVMRLKYHRGLAEAQLLGQLLAWAVRARAPDWLEGVECLVPVPLHRRRLRERGYNQAHELALVLSAVLRIPLCAHGVARVVDTRPQAGLSAGQRARNLAGAFAVAPGFPYRHVAIVDDVLTTGRTVGALTRALRGAGVEWVSVLTACRAT